MYLTVIRGSITDNVISFNDWLKPFNLQRHRQIYSKANTSIDVTRGHVYSIVCVCPWKLTVQGGTVAGLVVAVDGSTQSKKEQAYLEYIYIY